MNSEQKPNIILITADSLRPDFLGCYGSKKRLSNNIDKIAERSLLFTRAISPSYPTFFTFPSIMCGIKPFEHGKYLGIPPANNVRTIAETLKTSGYATFAVVSDNPFLYGKYYGYDRGFDFYYDYQNQDIRKGEIIRKITDNILNASQKNKLHKIINALNYSRGKGPSAKSDEINEKALKLIGDRVKNKPFFLWLHYMDTHAPFDSGLPFFDLYGKHSIKNIMAKIKFCANILSYLKSQKINNPEELRVVMSMYEASVKSLDRGIGNFVKSIENIENTYIILTADHGEEFMEHGNFYHEPNMPYNEIIKVPLMIMGPEICPKKINKTVSLINVQKTICNIANITCEHIKGFDLTSTDKNDLKIHFSHNNTTKSLFFERKFLQVLISQGIFNNQKEITGYEEVGSINTDKYKFIYKTKQAEEELYDLERDPLEKNNIIHSDPHTAEYFRKMLSKINS